MSLAPELNAQLTENEFQLFSVQQGLSHNLVRCVQQDAKGYIWAGTEDGLNRFDGHRFEQWNQSSAIIPLPYSQVLHIKPLSQSRLLFITRGGAIAINTNNYAAEKYIIPDSSSFSYHLNRFWDAVELPDSSIAFSTATGFYVFDKRGKLGFRYDAFQKKDAGQKSIFYGRNLYLYGSEKILAVVKENQLILYDHKAKTFQRLNHTDKLNKAFDSNKRKLLLHYALDSSRILLLYWHCDSIYVLNLRTKKITASYMGTISEKLFYWNSKLIKLSNSLYGISGEQNGMYTFDFDSGKETCNFNLNKKFPSYTIQCFFKDRDNRLWIGTTAGLLKENKRILPVETFSTGNFKTDSAATPASCFFRYKNYLYTGFLFPARGVAVYDTATHKLLKFIRFSKHNFQENEIRSIQMYHQDTLWVGTNYGIFWLHTTTHRYGKVKSEDFPELSSIVSNLFPASASGNGWIVHSLSGSVYRYNIKQRKLFQFTKTSKPALPFYLVKHITHDSDGNTWIGGHGVARYNYRLNQFDTYINSYAGIHPFDDDVICMQSDSLGGLWLHNPQNGLLRLDVKYHTFKHFSTRNGFPTDVIYSMSPVVANHLWIGTQNRIIRFNTSTYEVLQYDFSDGVPIATNTSRQIYFDCETGYFYCGFENKISRFKLTEKSNTDGNKVQIYEVRVNKTNQLFYPANTLTLSYHQNSITIRFTIIDFEKNNNNFVWKLNDDSVWTDLGDSRQLELLNLSPGKYEIQIKTKGKPEAESVAFLTVTINPAFWQTNWFKLVWVLIGASIGWVVLKVYLHRLKREAFVDQQLAEAEMKALHAQMNPHFIFNCLNSIREMVLHQETRNASSYLSRFAELIRSTLNQSTQSFVSLQSTIDYLKLYIQMEQIRNHRFICNIGYSGEADPNDLQLPPMLIQPFIENAIWHGAGDGDRSVAVEVHFEQTAEMLRCTIDDNGIGIKMSKLGKSLQSSRHTSIGLSNIDKRIQLLNEKYQLQCSLTIIDKSIQTNNHQTGTLVTLMLPVTYKSDT